MSFSEELEARYRAMDDRDFALLVRDDLTVEARSIYDKEVERRNMDEHLEKLYRSMADDEFEAMNQEALTPNAKIWYDKELQHRRSPGYLQAKKQQIVHSELRGVHGWLRFWVVVCIYLGPISSVLQLPLAWVGYVSLARQNGGGIIIYGLITTAATIFLTVRGIQVGIALRDIKPRAVQSAKQWLLLVLAWTSIEPLLSLLCGFPGELFLSRAIAGIVLALISFAIWYSYFNVSKRVRATYPDWAER